MEKGFFENISSAYGYPFNVSYYNSPETFPLHWHNYAEIILTFADNVQYEVNGHLHTLMNNNILFIWPGELHSLIYQPQPCRTLILQFDYSTISAMKNFQDTQYLFQRLRLLKPQTSPDLAKQLIEILVTLKDFSLGNTPFKEVNMHIQLYQFFILLGNYLLNNSHFLSHEKESKKSELTQKMISVCNYISDHCEKKITLDDAAKHAGFSKYYFSRLFKNFTDASFTNFVTKERLHRSEVLLTNSNLPVTEIALQSGFNSISTFNRIFKQFKHCTPTEFKNLLQSSHD